MFLYLNPAYVWVAIKTKSCTIHEQQHKTYIEHSVPAVCWYDGIGTQIRFSAQLKMRHYWMRQIWNAFNFEKLQHKRKANKNRSADPSSWYVKTGTAKTDTPRTTVSSAWHILYSFDENSKVDRNNSDFPVDLVILVETDRDRDGVPDWETFCDRTSCDAIQRFHRLFLLQNFNSYALQRIWSSFFYQSSSEESSAEQTSFATLMVFVQAIESMETKIYNFLRADSTNWSAIATIFFCVSWWVHWFCLCKEVTQLCLPVTLTRQVAIQMSRSFVVGQQVL